MKKIGLVFLFITILHTLHSDAQATTDSGLRVILHEDGTWTYLDEQEIETKWSVSIKQDPINDSRVATYLLKADSGQSSWGKPIYLILRETDGNFDLFINWNDYLGSEIYITHRVDDKQAVVQEWNLSTDSQASFYPIHGNPKLNQIIHDLTQSQQFIARCVPYGENPTTVIFDVRGLSELFLKNNSAIP